MNLRSYFVVTFILLYKNCAEFCFPCLPIWKQQKVLTTYVVSSTVTPSLKLVSLHNYKTSVIVWSSNFPTVPFCPPGAGNVREKLWAPLPHPGGQQRLHRRRDGENHLPQEQPSHHRAGQSSVPHTGEMWNSPKISQIISFKLDQSFLYVFQQTGG